MKAMTGMCQSPAIACCLTFLIAGGAAAAAPSSNADSSEPTLRELRQQIDALQKKIDALEAKEASGTAHGAASEFRPATTQDVDGVVRRVLADAEARSRPLAGVTPFTAGWSDGKFLLRSEDGRFSLNPNIFLQFRYVATHREDGKNGGSDTQSGFEMRRAKIGFAGNAFGKDLSYSVILSGDRNGGTVRLDEWWARYKLDADWAIRGGQFKDPVAHEQLGSAKYTLAVDKSLLVNTFLPAEDYVQGVSLQYGGVNNPLAAEVAFTDGSPSTINTDFRDDPNPPGTPQSRPDFGVAGRVEYKVFGQWKNYASFTSLGMKEDLLVVGAGADFSQVSARDVFIHTVDVAYKLANGLSFYGAVMGRASDGGSGYGNDYDWGGLAQAAYLIDGKHLEVFGRYDYMELDSGSVSAGAPRRVHELTTGLNYYFEGQAAKFTIDLTYLPNGAPSDNTGTGVLKSDKSEFIVRAQFQLLM